MGLDGERIPSYGNAILAQVTLMHMVKMVGAHLSQQEVVTPNQTPRVEPILVRTASKT